jgi:hypothetical protein
MLLAPELAHILAHRTKPQPPLAAALLGPFLLLPGTSVPARVVFQILASHRIIPMGILPGRSFALKQLLYLFIDDVLD